MSTIGRNTIYNLAGLGIPLLLFVVTIPLYIHLIGAARFGVLSIVWLVLGLFGMLDLGLGRAATQKIASLKDGSAADRRAALGTALVGNVAISGAGALLMLGAAYYIFAYAMNLEPWLRAEAMSVVPLMAIGVPVVTTLGILNGALQGREKFFVTNRVAITNAALFQLLPLGVAWLFGPALWALVLAALCIRLIASATLWLECRREFGGVSLRQWHCADMIGMLRYGGWVTGAGALSMMHISSDRVVVGAILGAAGVAVFAIALDASRRITIISDAAANALFPQFAHLADNHSRELHRKATNILFSLSCPVFAVLIAGANVLMPLWLGREIGLQVAPLFCLLAFASWMMGFAKVPYAVIQARGRPDKITKLYLIEVPLAIAGFYYSIAHFGLVGGALFQIFRKSVDPLALRWLAGEPMRFDPVFVAAAVLLALMAAQGAFQIIGVPIWALWFWAFAIVAICILSFAKLPVPIVETVRAIVGKG